MVIEVFVVLQFLLLETGIHRGINTLHRESDEVGLSGHGALPDELLIRLGENLERDTHRFPVLIQEDPDRTVPQFQEATLDGLAGGIDPGPRGGGLKGKQGHEAQNGENSQIHGNN